MADRGYTPTHTEAFAVWKRISNQTMKFFIGCGLCTIIGAVAGVLIGGDILTMPAAGIGAIIGSTIANTITGNRLYHESGDNILVALFIGCLGSFLGMIKSLIGAIMFGLIIGFFGEYLFGEMHGFIAIGTTIGASIGGIIHIHSMATLL